MKLEDLQVDIKPYTPGQAVALATRMLQHQPGPILGSWGFSSALIFSFSLFLLSKTPFSPVWVWIMVLLLAPLFLLPIITSVGHLVFSPAISMVVIIRRTLERLLQFVLLFFASRMLLLLGLLCLIIPGLYLWRVGWFLSPIVLLEGASFVSSFRRTRRFSLGFHRQTLAHALNTGLLFIYLALAFASLIHFFLVQVLGLTFATLAELPLHPWYYHLLGLGGVALAAPFAMLVWFFVYLDVRIRKEGWDLEIAFRARAAQLERTIPNET